MTDPRIFDAWSTTNYKSQLPAGELWTFVTPEQQEILDLYDQLSLELQAEAKVRLRRLAQGEGI